MRSTETAEHMKMKLAKQWIMNKKQREQRRYEIAKAVLGGISANSDENIWNWDLDKQVKFAVSAADALLNELAK